MLKLQVSRFKSWTCTTKYIKQPYPGNRSVDRGRHDHSASVSVFPGQSTMQVVNIFICFVYLKFQSFSTCFHLTASYSHTIIFVLLPLAAALYPFTIVSPGNRQLGHYYVSITMLKVINCISFE